MQEMETIQRILDELVRHAMRRNASRVTAEISNLPAEVMITVQDDGKEYTAAEQQELLTSLNVGRRDELESYYGVLLGEAHAGEDLSLLGTMIDSAELQVSAGSGNRLTVHRQKGGGMR